MSSVDELKNKTFSLMATSDDLISRLSYFSQKLEGEGHSLFNIVRGSSTGEVAARTMIQASREVMQATASVSALKRELEKYLGNIQM